MIYIIYSVLFCLTTAINPFSVELESKVNLCEQVKNDSSIICGKWRLIRTVNKPEKTTYKDSGNSKLTFKCDPNEWTITDDNGHSSNGNWNFKNDDTQVELINGDKKLIFEIVEVSSGKLILGLDDTEMIYSK